MTGRVAYDYPAYYRDRAAEHGMSVEMFDLLDWFAGEDDTSKTEVRREFGRPGVRLLERGVQEGYLWRDGRGRYFITPKGSQPFGGLSEHYVGELRARGWRG